MLPDGWKETTLERYIHIKHGYAFKGEYFSASGKYIVLTPGNFIESGGFRDQKDKTKYYSGEIPEEYILKKGDCILAMTEQAAGLLGSAAFIPENNKFLHNQRIGLIEITDPHSVSLDFLYWLYNDPKNRLIISNEAGGTKVKHTSPKKLVDISILLPPLPEQKKIAVIFSTWDRAIEGTEKLLANSQQQKKALMQQLLTGKKRLPGFTGEWKNVLLKDIALIKKGQALSSKDLMRGDYPVIAGGKTSPYKHKNFTHENVITVSASGAYAGYVSFHSYKIWASDCSVITSRSGNSISFIYFWLSYLQNKIFSLQSGGAQPHIYPRDLELLHIHCPPLPEQKAIAAVLSTADEELAAIEADLARLRQEKKALMQQLLTGKRRVKVD